jgi:Aromatic-ring-opening dioxygenase LigAB, LigA subunit
MSLYQVQKLIYQLNRDPRTRERYATERDAVLAEYELTDEEQRAIARPDIGLLYVLGVNGQLLMHFAALHEIEWNDYLERMRQGLKTHGPVREGVYAATGYEGVEAHDARIKKQREAS